MGAPPKRVPLRKIVPKPGDAAKDVAKQIQDNVEDALNKMAAANQFGFVPIGTIVFIDISLPGVPAPPANWVACNGQQVTDQKSPLYGQTLRDINKAGNFIRGSTVSGTVQAADAIVPAHAHSMNAHTHDMNSHVHALGGSHTHAATGLTFAGNALAAHQHEISTSASTGGTFTAVAANNRLDDNLGGFTRAISAGTPSGSINGTTASANAGNSAGPSVANTLGPSVANTASDGGSGAETRPKNVSMVAYIRIW